MIEITKELIGKYVVIKEEFVLGREPIYKRLYKCNEIDGETPNKLIIGQFYESPGEDQVMTKYSIERFATKEEVETLKNLELLIGAIPSLTHLLVTMVEPLIEVFRPFLDWLPDFYKLGLTNNDLTSILRGREENESN
jgi:hypothetical protein